LHLDPHLKNCKSSVRLLLGRGPVAEPSIVVMIRGTATELGSTNYTTQERLTRLEISLHSVHYAFTLHGGPQCAIVAVQRLRSTALKTLALRFLSRPIHKSACPSWWWTNLDEALARLCAQTPVREIIVQTFKGTVTMDTSTTLPHLESLDILQ
jgi:hypothetical protein